MQSISESARCVVGWESSMMDRVLSQLVSNHVNAATLISSAGVWVEKSIY